MNTTTLDEFKKEFPEKDYDQKTWTFSNQEKASLQTYNTIKEMGEMANVLIDKLVNGVALPRVGYTPRKGLASIYDLPEGKFTVFSPKFWCEACKDNPATHSYDGKKYCGQCATLVQLKDEVDKEKSGE